MRNKRILYVDQYGNRWQAKTVRDLCSQIGRTRARRMYRDKMNGPPVHVGYVVGHHWCTAYVPMENTA